jgi:hypothetical protein
MKVNYIEINYHTDDDPLIISGIDDITKGSTDDPPRFNVELFLETKAAKNGKTTCYYRVYQEGTKADAKLLNETHKKYYYKRVNRIQETGEELDLLLELQELYKEKK